MTLAKPSVSILIVSYNTCDMTIACIRSVVEQTAQTDYEIIVVDNASSDGSADAIAREFPQIRLVRSHENLGFACANNLACEQAHGTFLLLLNPDTVVLDHAIDRLVAFANANLGARIWGGRTLFSDRTLNPTSCWRFMSPWSIFSQAIGLAAIGRDTPLFNPEGYGGWSRDRVREVDIVTGCFLLIDRKLWEQLSGFDERFFMYAEEADLCWRARRLGARPLFTPDATIIHYGGASEPVFSAKTVRVFTGKVCFMKKHWSPTRQAIGIGLLQLATLFRAVGFTVASAAIRNKRYELAAGEWREIWSARRQWEKGYAAPAGTVSYGSDPRSRP